MLRSKLQELRDEAKNELGLAENILRKADETDQLFAWHARKLFDRCIDKYRNETFMASHDRDDVESNVEKIKHSLTVCMSLLESTHISKGDVDTCETEIREATGMLQCRDQPETEVIWRKYSQLLMDEFRELAQDAPTSDSSDSTGKL